MDANCKKKSEEPNSTYQLNSNPDILPLKFENQKPNNILHGLESKFLFCNLSCFYLIPKSKFRKGK